MLSQWDMEQQRIKKARFIKVYLACVKNGTMADRNKRGFGKITLKDLKKRFRISYDTASNWAREAKEVA